MPALEGELSGVVSPAEIRKASQARIRRWQRQLQDKIASEKRRRRKAIAELLAVDGLSERGARFIAFWEGCRLVAYEDPLVPGLLTIGCGHTGPDVKPGMSISFKEAMRLLQADAEYVDEMLDDALEVKLTEERRDATISIGFNIGINGLRSSTLLKRINSGASGELIRDAFLMWVKANGVFVQGLANRRRAEALLFNRGDYGAALDG
jgi:lysozyme